MHRKARFIWTPDQKRNEAVNFGTLLRNGPVRRDDGSNRWFLFRREFELLADPDSAKIEITVDGRYQLFVNGERAGRGPTRASPDFQRYDVHDIGALLKPGKNVLAALVHVYGVDTAWYQTAKCSWQSIFGDGGLYVHAKILGGPKPLEIVSDTSWKCRECLAWTKDTPRSGWGQDFIEDFDANLMPVGWSAAGFDDSGWLSAQCQYWEGDAEDQVKGWGPIEPFPTLIRGEIPPPLEACVAPSRIVAAYGVKPRPDLAVDRRLYDEELIALDHGAIEHPDALLINDARETRVRTLPDHDVMLLVAFDPPHTGYPFIEIDAQGGEVIELAVAETYLGEYAPKPDTSPRITRNTHLDCAHLFRYTARPGRQRFEKFEWAAIRYAQIVIRNAPKGIKIRHVGSRSTQYRAGNRGAFACSDAFLNTLWNVGRYTALLSTHDAWEDGPGREKRQWLGDGLVHYLVHAAAFGPSTQPVDRQFLLHGLESQRADGLLQMFAPGDHHDNGIVIPDFCLHWICTAHQYLLHTGDEATADEVFPGIQRCLAWFERHIGPNGLLAALPHWHFIEWANVGRHGEAAIINALFIGALRAASAIAAYLGNERQASRYAQLADKVTVSINSRLWDADRGVYADSVDPDSGLQSVRVSQHANAAMILWDIAPPSSWDGIIKYIADPARAKMTAAPPIVPKGEPFSPESDVVRTNIYFSHFLYSALAKAQRFDLALDVMRKSYSSMLDTGTKTLWESFEPTTSLCHAFSASPVYQLSAHVLGVEPLAPGFTRFRIAPQLCELAHASGVYPTVHGDISVEWTKSETGIALKYSAPACCVAEIVAPKGYRLQDKQEPGDARSRHVIMLFCGKH